MTLKGVVALADAVRIKIVSSDSRQQNDLTIYIVHDSDGLHTLKRGDQVEVEIRAVSSGVPVKPERN
jgi:hypothetical protein